MGKYPHCLIRTIESKREVKKIREKQNVRKKLIEIGARLQMRIFLGFFFPTLPITLHQVIFGYVHFAPNFAPNFASKNFFTTPHTTFLLYLGTYIHMFIIYLTITKNNFIYSITTFFTYRIFFQKLTIYTLTKIFEIYFAPTKYIDLGFWVNQALN